MFGLCWRTHSKKSMLLISSIACSKLSWSQTRKGCSNTRLLSAEGWWYWRAPVYVLRKIKPKAKLVLNTVVWSVKMWFSCSRREAGLIVDRRKLYQSWSRFWRLNLVRILWPVLSVHLGNVSLTTGNMVCRNQQWIGFPARTCSCSRRLRSGWWFRRCICTCLVWPLRFFRSWCVCVFLSGGAFTSCSGLCSWMRGANMSVVGRAVVKRLTTRTTSEPAFGGSLVVCFEVTIEMWFLGEAFVAASALVRFHPSVYSQMCFEVIQTVMFSRRCQRCSLRGFLVAGFPEPVWTSYN